MSKSVRIFAPVVNFYNVQILNGTGDFRTISITRRVIQSQNPIFRAPIPSYDISMLEKTFMGERDFSQRLQNEMNELIRENADLKERIANLESQLRWTEAELARRP